MANEIAKLFVTVDADMRGMQSKLQKMGPQLKKVGMAATAMGGVIVGALGMAMKSAADFEGSMREVNTMMGLGEEEFKGFSKEVQNLAADLGVNAVDSAKALYQAISAGVPKENVLEFLAIATKAAIGGVTDTETAVDGLTTVINAFKLPMSDAQKVADIMFTTVKGGKTTFDELSASLFQVAPIAAASGVKFEEVAAALATMTKQGVPTSVATTQLRQTMVSLQKPTKDMAEVIEAMGFESGQAMLDELGLADALNRLRGYTLGSNEQLMKMFGSVEAGAAVLSLTGDNAAMFAEDLKAMTLAEGAATDAFEEMEKSTKRQMEKLKASFSDVAISIGNVLLPVLTDIVESIKPVIETIKNWMKENPDLVKTIIKVVAVVGSLLLVIGPLLMFLPGIIAALPILGAAFALLLGPIGLIIAAIAGLIAIGVLVWKNWDSIVSFFQGIPGKIGTAFSTLKDIILAPFRTAWQAIGAGINWLIKQFNKIKFDIPSWIPGIGGKSFGINLPKIALPEFKTGGIFTQPVAGVIGDVPEVVLPLSKLKGMGSTVNLYVSGSVITERDLISMIREALLEMKSSNVNLGLT